MLRVFQSYTSITACFKLFMLARIKKFALNRTSLFSSFVTFLQACRKVTIDSGNRWLSISYDTICSKFDELKNFILVYITRNSVI